MVPAQRLQVPLYGAEPERRQVERLGLRVETKAPSASMLKDGRFVNIMPDPQVCRQPGKDPVEAGPEGVSRAPGEGIPGAGKKRTWGKGVKRPLTPLRREGGGSFHGAPPQNGV